MDKTGEYQNRRAGALLLVFLFGLGLAWLSLTGLAWGDVKEDWVRRYHGPAGSLNMPTAMALDSQGNIYVTGYSEVDYKECDFATVKYSPKGERIWLRRYYNGSATAIAVDGQGNVYVTGYSREKYLTIKYNTNGKLLWKSSHYLPRWDNYPSAIFVDGQGNVYVTGTAGWESGYGYGTIKYDTNGTLLWEANYGGTGKYYPSFCPTEMAVDGQGNVYLTCVVENDQGYTYFGTIKYSSEGQALWGRYYKRPGKSYSIPKGIALDSQGNVYVTGASWISETWSDFITIKYSPSGKQQWINLYDGPASGGDSPDAIAVDSQDNIYVAGSSAKWRGEYADSGFAVIKYSSDGQCLWIRRYSGQGTWINWWKDKSLAIDSQDNVYVTGKGGQFITIKYSPAGELLWMIGYDNHYAGHPVATAVDGHGNVYVTANEANGFISTADYITIKYKQSTRTWR